MSVSKSIFYKVLFAVGWCLFWMAASRGEQVPIVVLLVGPAMMFMAIILLRSFRSKHHQRSRVLPDATPSKPGSVAQQPLQSDEEAVKPSTQSRIQGASREGAPA